MSSSQFGGRRCPVHVFVALLAILQLGHSTFLRAEECSEAVPQPESEAFRFLPSAEHQALGASVPPGSVIRSIQITRYSVFCNMERQSKSRMEEPSTDFTRYDQLPLGQVKVLVQAEGFKHKELDLVLRPGKPELTTVVLDSK